MVDSKTTRNNAATEAGTQNSKEEKDLEKQVESITEEKGSSINAGVRHCHVIRGIPEKEQQLHDVLREKVSPNPPNYQDQQVSQSYKRALENYYDPEEFQSAPRSQRDHDDIQPLPVGLRLSRQQRQRQQPSQPGAYPLGGWNNPRGADDDPGVYSDLEEEDGEETTVDEVSHGGSTNNNNEEGLVEANPVEGDSKAFSRDDLEVAEPVVGNPCRAYSPPQKSNRTSIGLCLLIGLPVLLLMLVGLIIALVGQSSSSSSSGDNSLSQEQPHIGTDPTDTVMSEHLMTLLPSYTQTKILSDLSTNSTPQAQAYFWLRDDPHFDNYTDKRLLQRYAMAVFFLSTNGTDWKHQGGGEVPVMIGRPKDPRISQPSTPPPNTTAGTSMASNSSFGIGLPSSPRPGSGGGTGGGPLDFYNVTRPQWLDYEAHECLWFGTNRARTSCTNGDNNTIVDISLKQNNLGGSLPEELGLLTSLTKLNLFRNNIGGTMVTTLGLLTNLVTLKFNSNKIGGTIPSEIGRLSNTLQVLGLVHNRLVGEEEERTKPGSFPPEVWKLSNLVEFTMGRNQFVDSVPAQLPTLFPNLRLFIFGRMQLTGTLPTSLGNCATLQEFVVSVNQLRGTIPSQMGTMFNLTALKLDENDLTGTIPSQLGLLASGGNNLEELLLHGNANLVGTLPSELGRLNATLSRLDVTGTGISGTIPVELCQIPKMSFDCSPSVLCGCTCECS